MDNEADKTRTTPGDVSPQQREVTERMVTIDDFAPRCDFAAVEHQVVDASPDVTYSATRHLDLLDVHSRIADLAMWARGMPQRLRRHGLPRTRTRLTIDDLVAGGNWVLLGEQPGREVVFGAVGRFWTPIVRSVPVSAAEFGEYGKPRTGKIVASLSVRPYGHQRSLVSYDIRTVLNDPITRRVFGLYWRTVSPFIKLIMRATLRAASRQAERATTAR